MIYQKGRQIEIIPDVVKFQNKGFEIESTVSFSYLCESVFVEFFQLSWDSIFDFANAPFSEVEVVPPFLFLMRSQSQSSSMNHDE